MGDVKNSKTRVAWSLKKERASLVVENFKEAMDHLGSVDVISSAAFLVRNQFRSIGYYDVLLLLGVWPSISAEGAP